jgi:hypothetical protein
VAAADHNLIYLASPYSKYPAGIDKAFEDISALAGALLVKGYKVYSPIAHTHPIAMYAKLDAYDHTIWLPFDQAIMQACDAMIIAKMETWDKSFGIGEEIKFFRAADKPIYGLNPMTLEIEVMQ